MQAKRKMPVQKPGLSVQNYSTPADLILAIKRRFIPMLPQAFDYDLAAEPENAKAVHFFTEEEDSLKQEWPPGNLWLNPPFENIGPWAKKCAQYVRSPWKKWGRVFFLTPASVGSRWFADHVWCNAAVYALVGRPSFDSKGPYPKDCMLSVFDRSAAFLKWECGVFEPWDWRPIDLYPTTHVTPEIE